MSVEERFKSIVADVLNVDDAKVLGACGLIDDLGADSLDHIEILMAVEVEFDVDLDDEDLEKILTVNDGIRLITKALAANNQTTGE